jgi:hypothetical protein
MSANPGTPASKRVHQPASPEQSPRTRKRSRDAALYVHRQQNKTKTAELLPPTNLGSASNAFSPSSQDSNDAQSQDNTATAPKQAQISLHLPTSEALSKVDQSNLLDTNASSSGLDSQHQQALYHLVRANPGSGQIFAEITRYHKRGKQLPWFQEVIPSLRPGIEDEDDVAWLLAARAMLWDDNHNVQHKEICKRTIELSRVRTNLPLDAYGLRQSWPSMIEGLRPISNELATALNQVSYLLGRADCHLSHTTRSWSDPSSGRTQSDQTYVVVRQAMQDKIISPIVDDLSSKLYHPSDTAPKDQKYDSSLFYDDGVIIETEQGSDSIQIVETKKLLEALQHLRAIIIDEKDTRDSGSAKKKPGSTKGEPGGVFEDGHQS